MFIDKYRERDTFGIFRESGFNAVTYEGDNAEELAVFMEQVREFNEFCKQAYFAVQQGAELPDVPSFIKPRKVTRAKAQKSSSEEG